LALVADSKLRVPNLKSAIEVAAGALALEIEGLDLGVSCISTWFFTSFLHLQVNHSPWLTLMYDLLSYTQGMWRQLRPRQLTPAGG
jgi:hypothetical protein